MMGPPSKAYRETVDFCIDKVKYTADQTNTKLKFLTEVKERFPDAIPTWEEYHFLSKSLSVSDCTNIEPEQVAGYETSLSPYVKIGCYKVFPADPETRDPKKFHKLSMRSDKLYQYPSIIEAIKNVMSKERKPGYWCKKLQDWYDKEKEEGRVLDIKFFPNLENNDIDVEDAAREAYEVVTGQRETVDVTDEKL